jgi:hypothetical protein
MSGLAKEYGLALRVMGRFWIEKLQSQGLPTNDHDFLDSYGLDPGGKAARYAQMLHDLPAGLNEWAVHPGLDNAELLAIEPAGHHERQTDFDFWTSREAHDIVRQEGIVLLDYRGLRAIWQGGMMKCACAAAMGLRANTNASPRRRLSEDATHVRPDIRRLHADIIAHGEHRRRADRGPSAESIALLAAPALLASPASGPGGGRRLELMKRESRIFSSVASGRWLSGLARVSQCSVWSASAPASRCRRRRRGSGRLAARAWAAENVLRTSGDPKTWRASSCP